MSRTCAGYLFTCKRCGKVHFMVDSGTPRDGIRLPCVEFKHAINEYEEKEFKYWHGNYWDVFDISVREEK